MGILNKYLLFMILKKTIFSLTALVLIFSFFKFLDELNHINQTDYEMSDVIAHTIFLIPTISNSLLTISFLLGTTFALGTLNSNKEIQIFLTGGISYTTLISKAIKFNLLLVVIFQIFLETFSPLSYQIAQSIKNEKMGMSSSTEAINFWTKRDSQFIFFDILTNNKVSLFEVDSNNLINITEGYNPIFKDKTLTIKNLTIKKINQDKKFAIINEIPSQNSIEIPLSENDLLILRKDYQEMSVVELIKALAISLHNSIESKNYFHELISRIIKPINLLGMILIAIPFILKLDRTVSIGRMLFVSISIGILSNLITKVLTMTSNYFDNLSELLVFVPSLMLILLGVFLSRKNLS